MNEKYLNKIEYDKIINLLTKHVDSEPGKKTANEIHPMTDLDTIRSSLEEISSSIYFVKAKGKPNFEGLREIDSIIKRLNVKGTLNNKELLIIKDNSYLARKAYEASESISIYCKNEVDDIKTKMSSLVPLYDLESEIRRCIISEDDIADDASSELMRIRRAIFKNQDAIKEKLISFTKSERYKKYLQESIITIRQDRYVLPVKNEYKNEVKGVVHDTSQTGSTLFIEPIEIVNLNNKIRELLTEEKKEIEKILKLLSEQCAIYSEQISENFNTCCYLDVAFGKASFALTYKGTVPEINNNRIIRLFNARHPLISPETVVPIDFKIGEDYTILVITGPNTGGKTVSLKTVGLLTAMTQSGLAIPVNEGSAVAVFSDIFVDIGDEQSIEQNLSTFSSHMTNIINILKQANSESLVLLDELGAGTDPVEGSALALAIIDTLKQKSITSVATTHYTELKTYASVTENVENASCEFDVKTLKPTYRLLIGIPGKSNALYISRRLGLSEDIISKANSSIDNKNSDYEDIILALEKNRQKMEKERLKASEYKNQIEQIKKQLEKEQQNIEKEKAKILEKAENDAKKLIDRAIEKAELLIKEIDNLKRNNITVNAKAEAEFRSVIRQTKELFDSTDNEDKVYNNTQADTEIKIGDTVMLIELRQKASVLTNPDKNGDITIQAGIIKMSVNINDVSLVDEQKQINERLKSKIIKSSSPAKMEIDIRGNTMFESESKLDQFIEQGFYAGLHELSIIHGKGTGALRKGVHDYLKRNSYVKSFRIGAYGEGEAGVTVVFLKEKNL
ncbi:MAG TPA: endonuclease MutS2 [Clostridia bacterium]|nr:endonuclease MutS2 [Clostridia bacterium]